MAPEDLFNEDRPAQTALRRILLAGAPDFLHDLYLCTEQERNRALDMLAASDWTEHDFVDALRCQAEDRHRG